MLLILGVSRSHYFVYRPVVLVDFVFVLATFAAPLIIDSNNWSNVEIMWMQWHEWEDGCVSLPSLANAILFACYHLLNYKFISLL